MIDYADIEAGTVTADALAKLHRRGCLIVRGHFPHEQALAWDQDIVDYVESNRFFENYRGPGDDFFGSVGSKPEIYPDLLVARADAGPPERPDGHACRPSSTASGRTSPTACSGSTPTATRSTPTASAAGPRAPTPAASAPTSTPAPSTCG